MRSSLRFLGPWLLLAAALPAAAEDLAIVSKLTREGSPPQTVASYFGSGRMRANQGDQEFISDFVVTKQEMEAFAAQMQEQMKQMEAQMANMPPALREKMAGMMGGVAQAIDVRKGAGGRTVAGYASDNWVVSMGEMMKQEQCMTIQLQYPVQAWDAYKSFSSSMAGMAGPMAKGMAQLYDTFKDMKGVPLASTSTVKVLGKTMTSATEVTEIKKGPIPASAWQVPAGYKKVGSPMAKALKK